jgi:large subunit ribosomal protein L18
MSKIVHRTKAAKRSLSVRKKLHGTASKPRLSVYRSNCHISLQLINDDKEVTILGENDFGKEKKMAGTKTEHSQEVAKELAKKMKTAKVKKIVFDRGPYRYHGRVKAVAETLRQAGINF